MGQSEIDITKAVKEESLLKALFNPRPEELESSVNFCLTGQFYNVFNASLAIFCIWSVNHAQLFLGWLAVTFIVSLLLWLRAKRALGDAEAFHNPRNIYVVIWYAFISALPWPVLCFIVLDISSLEASVFVLFLCVGKAAGGAVSLYRVPLAAFTYVITLFLPTALAVTMSVFSDLWTIGLFTFTFHLILGVTICKSWMLVREREDGLKEAFYENMQLQNKNEEIERLNLTDPLTGLFNRKAFIEKLNKKIATIEDNSFAVFLMDLDRFKHLNDNLGHDAGDELLQIVGRRLKNAVSSMDVIARFGGDEFALIIHSPEGKNRSELVAQRILDVLNQSVTLKSSLINPKASIGIAYYPDNSTEAEELVRLADIALLYAKEQGRGRYELFDHEMAHSFVYANSIEKALVNSLKNNTLEIYYQPKIDMRSNKIVGVEALLRCYCALGKEITRELLFRVASERGLISEISGFTFNRVTEDILSWHSQGIDYLPVSINVHAYDLKAPDHMFMQLKQMFSKGIREQDIILEINEDSLSGRGSDAANATVDIADEMGIKLSLDDFGTGHTALSSLKKLPVSEIKIDREFIQGLTYDDRDKAIALAALGIAKCLNITCVAEGVETQEQIDMLKALSSGEVDLIAQGHFWAAAMKADRLIEFVMHHQFSENGQQLSLNYEAHS